MRGMDGETEALVADVTLTCVREFLSKRGLKAVLALLDEQAPRKEGSISKRSELAKFLGVRLPPGPAVGSRRRIPVPGTR